MMRNEQRKAEILEMPSPEQRSTLSQIQAERSEAKLCSVLKIQEALENDNLSKRNILKLDAKVNERILKYIHKEQPTLRVSLQEKIMA